MVHAQLHKVRLFAQVRDHGLLALGEEGPGNAGGVARLAEQTERGLVADAEVVVANVLFVAVHGVVVVAKELLGGGEVDAREQHVRAPLGTPVPHVCDSSAAPPIRGTYIRHCRWPPDLARHLKVREALGDVFLPDDDVRRVHLFTVIFSKKRGGAPYEPRTARCACGSCQSWRQRAAPRDTQSPVSALRPTSVSEQT